MIIFCRICPPQNIKKAFCVGDNACLIGKWKICVRGVLGTILKAGRV